VILLPNTRPNPYQGSGVKACIIDVPTSPTSEIHPRDKEPVGEWLALAALVQTYPQINVVYSGPIRNVSQSVIGSPTEEPGAGKLYAGMCGGASGNRRPYRDGGSQSRAVLDRATLIVTLSYG